jgi:broad specificity phosphatase PhoE
LHIFYICVIILLVTQSTATPNPGVILKKTKTSLLFLRHGKTAYTGQFPDLTEEGVKQIQSAAAEIAQIIQTHHKAGADIQIVSSPAPRALGTADIIARHLGHPHEVEPCLDIRCMDFYDVDGANALWREFGTARDVDRAYATDPRFDTGEVIEARCNIQHRFFYYLGELFERFAEGKLPDVVIHTCHFEVLYFLASMLMGIDDTEPLIHGEIIRIGLEPGGDRHHVLVTQVFRGHTKTNVFALPSAAFQHQFAIAPYR